jgi:hypothetical protein
MDEILPAFMAKYNSTVKHNTSFGFSVLNEHQPILKLNTGDTVT